MKVYTKDRLPKKEGYYFCYNVSEGRCVDYFNPECDVDYWKTMVEYWIDENPSPLKKQNN